MRRGSRHSKTASKRLVLSTWLILSLFATQAAAQPANTPSPPSPTPSVSTLQPPSAKAIESSALNGALSPDAQQALLIKIQTLLDRAHFSPGVIDGRPGANLHNAMVAYSEAHGLATDGALSAQLFNTLTSSDKAPITQSYTITQADAKGPFIRAAPKDFTSMAQLKHLGYRDPVQELAERFHMSENLLRALNPGANFVLVGTSILVVRPGNGELGQRVARVEVDKSNNQLRVYDDTGTVIAAYPATVGSTERPAPSGRWAVKSVTINPDYVYDPKRLTFKKVRHKLTIAPGPNNPVGTIWIALTKETYGIHGSPDPSLVGKTASHGCVRLTNWDAAALARSVTKGTPVLFVGETQKK